MTNAERDFLVAARAYAAALIENEPGLTDDGVSYTGLLAGAYRAMLAEETAARDTKLNREVI